MPATGAELPSQDIACLEGLDLPCLDDLLWEDAVCNDFGVQPHSSASTHQSEQCQLPDCIDCASARPAQVFRNWSPPAPCVSSGSHKAAYQQQEVDSISRKAVQQQQEVDSAPAAPSPALQLPTPPQAEGAADARQEPSSSRDSCHYEACSPQSSCDLPESGHKRRRSADSSPECAGSAGAAHTSSPSDTAVASQVCRCIKLMSVSWLVKVLWQSSNESGSTYLESSESSGVKVWKPGHLLNMLTGSHSLQTDIQIEARL